MYASRGRWICTRALGNVRSASRTPVVVRRTVLWRMALHRAGQPVGYPRCVLSLLTRYPFGTAPTTVSTGFPPLKNNRVGIERTLNRIGVLGFASTSILATFALPSYSCASCSSTGAIIWHGPHQVAQKLRIAGPW